jgi:hypothetical protein
MKPANVADVYVLSPMQLGMLFHSLMAPEAALYVNQTELTLTGRLDPASMRRAWDRVVARHTILRTAFHWRGLRVPHQVVWHQATLPYAEHDLRILPAPARGERLAELLRAHRARPFALSAAPLMRVALVRWDEDEHRLLWWRHHIVLDGWSQQQQLREVLTLHEVHADRGRAPVDEDALLGPPVPYRRYVRWLREREGEADGAEAFWRDQLSGITAPTPLDAGWTPRPPAQAGVAEEVAAHALDAATTARIRAAARRAALTLPSLVHGAWALSLAARSGSRDVVWGCTVSGRPADLPGADRMIGCFINTLPVRARVVRSARLADWLAGVQRTVLDVRRYEHTPLVDVHGHSDVPRTLPLFESVVVAGNDPARLMPREDGLRLRLADVRLRLSNSFPLTIRVLPGDAARLEVLFDRDRVGAAAASEALAQVVHVLEAFAGRPNAVVGDVVGELAALARRRPERRDAERRASSLARLRALGVGGGV